jgi:hypothetical protein
LAGAYKRLVKIAEDNLGEDISGEPSLHDVSAAAKALDEEWMQTGSCWSKWDKEDPAKKRRKSSKVTQPTRLNTTD